MNANRQQKAEAKLPQVKKEVPYCATCEECVKATVYCKECDEYYCEECNAYLHKLGVMKKHVRSKVSVVRQKRECPLHKESKLSLYCETERSIKNTANHIRIILL